MVKWIGIRSKHPLETKRIECTYSKILRIRVIYHDTWTHYLMEQDPLLLQDQAEVMDVATADKVEVLKNKEMGPPGPCSSRSGSRYSMSRTCGPRHIISLVIPKLGDNKYLFDSPNMITRILFFYCEVVEPRSI
jgi:hypothetical protein